MKKASFDPGLGQKLEGKLQRIIEDDGSFAVDRSNTPFSSFNPYIYLISLSWPRFFAIIVFGFAAINVLFAAVYYLIGLENLRGAEYTSGVGAFLNACYFSVHTFTTVGYGNMAPSGTLMNVVSIIEILSGVLCVALITGLLYGRFSRPSARLLYSENILISPFNSGSALMFRVANMRRNVLMELEADVMVMITTHNGSNTERSYRALSLERKRIVFLPLTWTLVHNIDEESPLYGMSIRDMQQAELQFLVLIKGFDDMFGQVVHSRYSYTVDDVVYGAKFEIAYHTRDDGRIDFDISKINAHISVPLNNGAPSLQAHTQ